eukprot:evm.model.scf_53EXC.3 EVM.evm.TU.scf_53EXC.3   scf_53EXC:35081-38768(+)
MSADAPSQGREKKEKVALIRNDGKRLDGRGLEEFRPVFMRTGMQARASGSAYLEFGKTKVMVAVYGPMPMKHKHGTPEEGQLKFEAHRLRPGEETRLEVEITALATEALQPCIQFDRFPKAVLHVNAVILEAGGSRLAAVITAASLAIAEVGIDMLDLVSACQVSRVEGRLVLDPSGMEHQAEEGGMTLAAMPTNQEVTQFVVTGEWSSSDIRESLELCLGGCAQVKKVMRQCLIDAHTAKGSK